MRLFILLLSEALMFAGQGTCLPDVTAVDVAGAASRFTIAAVEGCGDAAMGAIYLTGLVAAEEAWRQGGTDTALAPVRAAVTSLETRRGQPAAEIARLVLLAGAAAAQNERGELSLLLLQATQVERLQRAAGEPGLPYLTAHEAAGEFWMRVSRYADALRAYETAVEQIGASPRLQASLARARQRLQETTPAPR